MTNTGYSLLKIRIVIPDFKCHILIMPHRVYFIRTMKIRYVNSFNFLVLLCTMNYLRITAFSVGITKLIKIIILNKDIKIVTQFP